jgi:hypothetical protein
MQKPPLNNPGVFLAGKKPPEKAALKRFCLCRLSSLTQFSLISLAFSGSNTPFMSYLL